MFEHTPFPLFRHQQKEPEFTCGQTTYVNREINSKTYIRQYQIIQHERVQIIKLATSSF